MTELTKAETVAVQKAVISHWWLALRAMEDIRRTQRDPTEHERIAIAVWAGCELKMTVRRQVGDRVANVNEVGEIKVVILCANPVLITIKADGRFVIEEKEKPPVRAASGLRLVKG